MPTPGMKALSRVRHHLEASFWFIPAVIVLGSVGAAILLVEADFGTADLALWFPRLFGAGADGSRAMLSAIGTSMITVAGVVFSITIVALSLTSTQYSPRVLRNFMRDRPTQLVLGVFLGIFAYCLVVLRTIRGGDEGAFIPSIAVFAGMVYALAGISLLIFFIHHVALSIQSASILTRISDDTEKAIDRMFPAGLGKPIARARDALDVPDAWTGLPAARKGYVVAVDGDELLELATRSGRVLRLTVHVGDFVGEGTEILAASGTNPLDAAQRQRLLACVQIGTQRTVDQDVGFGLQQMVDVALRALSTGVNDPTTACMCIDQLTALLCRVAGREIPDEMRARAGKLQLVVPGRNFGDWLQIGLRPIAFHARGDLNVLRQLVNALELIATAAHPWPTRRQALLPLVHELHRALGELPSRGVARPLHGRLRRLERSLPLP
jgi:uncharacterized membrane protein